MKKVLIVTYYWPPAGGPGVQRILKFAKYFPEFGWDPVVLTVQNPDSPVEDVSLAEDIPAGCRIYKSRSLEPFDLYKKFTGKESGEKIPNDVLLKKENSGLKERFAQWVRANLFIPDAKIGWKYFGVKKGLEIIKRENINLIFTTSPPQTVALIGYELAKKTGLKWIADFRDPWMEIVYYQYIKRSGFAKCIDSKLEKKVFSHADAVVTISKDMADLFRSKVSDQKYHVIPNGFDQPDVEGFEKERSEKFTIAYTGTISKDRVPYPFLSAMKRIIESDGIKNIRFKFAGRFCKEFINEIEKLNLRDYCDLNEFVPHKESTKILLSSDILLLIIDNVPDNKGFLTGKLFEYMGCKRPIFAIGPVDGNANEIIRESDSGRMISYGDEEGAYHLLSELYNNWLTGELKFTFKVDKYSRKRLTEKLSAIFEEISD